MCNVLMSDFNEILDEGQDGKTVGKCGLGKRKPKMKKMSWIQKICDEEVVRCIGDRRTMLDTIKNRRRNCFGH